MSIAIEQEYRVGQELTFDLPLGIVSDLEISYRIPLLFARGEKARYAATPAGRYALFCRLAIDCNGPQIRTCPYFLKLRGMQSDDDSPVPEHGGGAIWEGHLRIPLTAMMSDTNPATLTLTTPSSLYGPDPLINAVTNAEKQDTRFRAFLRWLLRQKKLGTGHAVTTEGGTVSVTYVFP